MSGARGGMAIRRKCSGCDVEMSPERTLVCGRCRYEMYCGAECQKTDWPRHKKMCEKDVGEGVDDFMTCVAQSISRLDGQVFGDFPGRRRWCSNYLVEFSEIVHDEKELFEMLRAGFSIASGSRGRIAEDPTKRARFAVVIKGKPQTPFLGTPKRAFGVGLDVLTIILRRPGHATLCQETLLRDTSGTLKLREKKW